MRRCPSVSLTWGRPRCHVAVERVVVVGGSDRLMSYVPIHVIQALRGSLGLLGRQLRRRWLRRVLLGLMVAIVLLAGAGTLSTRRTKLVSTFEQPASVDYRDGDRHKATLWHITGVGTPVGLGPDHYEVLLGTTTRYGHIVRLEALGFDPTDLAVSWQVSGVWLLYGSGHQLFVPADRFVNTAQR